MRRATSPALRTSFPLITETRLEYDDFGNLAKDRQSHAGAVGGSTAAVAYAHEDGFYNNTRLTAMTYPNGRVVQMGYGTTGAGTTSSAGSRVSRSRENPTTRLPTASPAPNIEVNLTQWPGKS